MSAGRWIAGRDQVAHFTPPMKTRTNCGLMPVGRSSHGPSALAAGRASASRSSRSATCRRWSGRAQSRAQAAARWSRFSPSRASPPGRRPPAAWASPHPSKLEEEHMTSAIDDRRSRPARQRPDQVPRWSQPMVLDPARCTPLGAGRPPQLVRLARAAAGGRGGRRADLDPTTAPSRRGRTSGSSRTTAATCCSRCAAHVRGTYAARTPPATERREAAEAAASGRHARRRQPAHAAHAASGSSPIRGAPDHDHSRGTRARASSSCASGTGRRPGHRRRRSAPHSPPRRGQLLSPLLVPYLLNGAVHLRGHARTANPSRRSPSPSPFPTRSLGAGVHADMNENKLPTHRPATLRDVRRRRSTTSTRVGPSPASSSQGRCRDEPHHPEDGRRRPAAG